MAMRVVLIHREEGKCGENPSQQSLRLKSDSLPVATSVIISGNGERDNVI